MGATCRAQGKTLTHTPCHHGRAFWKLLGTFTPPHHHHGGAFWKLLGSPRGSPSPQSSPAGPCSANGLRAGAMPHDWCIQTPPMAPWVPDTGHRWAPPAPAPTAPQRDGKPLRREAALSCHAHLGYFGTRTSQVQTRPQHNGAHWSAPAGATESPQDPVTRPNKSHCMATSRWWVIVSAQVLKHGQMFIMSRLPESVSTKSSPLINSSSVPNKYAK